MPLQRHFSFDNGGEDLNAEQEQPSHGQQHFSPYRDSPARHSVISPPPHYASPPPLDDHDPISPIQPTTTRYYHPASHPDSAWAPSRVQQYTESSDLSRPILPATDYDETDSSPPRPPPHRRPVPSSQSDDRYRSNEMGYIPPPRTMSEVTPDIDNYGRQAEGGGLERVARNVADQNQRESGAEAMRAVQATGRPQGSSGSDTLYNSARFDAPRHNRAGSYSSGQPLATGAATPGAATPRLYPSNESAQSIPLDDFPAHSMYHSSSNDSPYLHSSRSYHGPVQNDIDPYNIADDGDDGFMPDPKRKSVMGIARQTSRNILPGAAAGGAVAGSGVMRSLSGMMGRRNKGHQQDTSYGRVDQPGAAAGPEAGVPGQPGHGEKSEWLSRQTKGNNKMRWTLLGVIGGVLLLAIIGGVIGGVVASKHSKSSSSSGTSSGGGAQPKPGSTNNAATDTAENGDLNKDSAEIKALMNNADLHKVFPAIDYTPWGTQYPLCLTYPPSQNNITRDMAVLSQLTNAVRLYGTDCNQTEMVLHAIDRLELTSMKVWLGVWIDETNQTTNDRQLSQMYKILDNADLSTFNGVIVGNEALFRAGVDKSTTEQELITTITQVKSNFTTLGYDLPVTTSDLGDNWNAEIVAAVDMVMSNIHPFFAGVTATQAASWTWTFWKGNDAPLTQGTTKKQIISETGWPSAGGNDCGTDTAGVALSCSSSTAGSVAGISEMNTFLEDWVCQALSNGTDYFWFEAFDEPWKVIYNTPGKDWETEWGLMDPARNLKSGLKIPDCDGKTVDS